ncbi:MAG: hypothetical protein JWO89_1508 [Verrucomicrobiaceae bacterium]|nr:hypothetical protein [Verrucomicrobiaceae bacterium]MDB6117844.1 hypothetical protein [Verrucomicrobiaceae bacterium]
MIAFKPSPSPVAAPANLHARLSAATEALLKTRDQVIEALDHHLHELDMLRSALGTNEKTLLPMMPALSTEPAPVPQYFERPPQALDSSLPLLTQVLWPTKHDAPLPVPMPVGVSAPVATSPAPVSSPLVAYSSLQSSCSKDLAMDPDLEKATLEELNAALAYAFSHVSSGRTGGPSPMTAGGPSWASSGTQGLGQGR